MPWLTLLKPYISRYLPLIFCGIGLVLMYLYWNDRTTRIAELEADKISLTASMMTQKASYELNLASLNRELADSNNLIDEANTKYNTLDRNSKSAREELKRQHDQRILKLNEKLQLLSAIPTPQTCDGAMSLIIDIAESNPWPVK